MAGDRRTVVNEKFDTWDEVAYDDAFGVVVNFRPGIGHNGRDVQVHFENNIIAWCWESDLSDADSRRAELA